jgi:AcrR family transcriptional regulator
MLRVNKQGQALGRKGEESRRRLLDATLALLTKGSMHKISASAIAREAAMASQSFYLYFKDIDEVILALAQEAAVDLQGVVALLANAPGDSEPKMLSKQVIDAFADYWDRHRPILIARNYIADSGNMQFLKLRQDATMPMIHALADRIQAARPDDITRVEAVSRAVVVYSAMERLAARALSAQYEPASGEIVDLRQAEIDILTLLFTPQKRQGSAAPARTVRSSGARSKTGAKNG